MHNLMNTPTIPDPENQKRASCFSTYKTYEYLRIYVVYAYKKWDYPDLCKRSNLFISPLKVTNTVILTQYGSFHLQQQRRRRGNRRAAICGLRQSQKITDHLYYHPCGRTYATLHQEATNYPINTLTLVCVMGPSK
jgi:hypothetical protein